MRRSLSHIALLVLVGLPLTTGCAARDVLFSMFGDHYTAGGTTSEERRHHYDSTMRRYESPVRHYDPIHDR